MWAIQVKGYDPESRVLTSEIDSFISASSRPEFDHRLLISTGQLSKNAEYKLTHQEKSTAFLLHHHLIESPVDWLVHLDGPQPALPDKKTPRPHQQKAIDDVRAKYDRELRSRTRRPSSGTGQTSSRTYQYQPGAPPPPPPPPPRAKLTPNCFLEHATGVQPCKQRPNTFQQLTWKRV